MYYGINNTRSRYSQKAHRAFQNPQFRVNWANIEQDTAIQKLKNFLTNVGIAGHLSGNVRKSIQQILFLGSVSLQNQKINLYLVCRQLFKYELSPKAFSGLNQVSSLREFENPRWRLLNAFQIVDTPQ